MGDSDPSQPTLDPSYGATPPPTGSSALDTPAPPPSTPAIATYESGQQAKPGAVTADPLYGATPPWQQEARTYTHNSRTIAPPHAIPRPTSPLPLYRPSTLPAFLKRLAYVLSLVLGSSAVIAGIWSAFLLPLLHASFSARRALVEAQRTRWGMLVEGLKEVRGRGMFPSPSILDGDMRSGDGEAEGVERGDEKALVSHRDDDRPAAEAMISSITSDFSLTQSTLLPGSLESEPEVPTPLIPVQPLAALTASLRELTSSLDSTSTTRTSLLSTLESYTSHLHREVFLRSDRFANSGGFSGGYSMSTLSANLAKAGGKAGRRAGASSRGGGDDDDNGDSKRGQGGLSQTGVKSEEWDAVRKEVRGIKGILLNRRNFASVMNGTRN